MIKKQDPSPGDFSQWVAPLCRIVDGDGGGGGGVVWHFCDTCHGNRANLKDFVFNFFLGLGGGNK